ncbi:DUF418 domain-containing protein [Cytobacillus spongiae]|uniref:DUF418 domain-containing protein n=1 Tax=Cytobacillus spongiae TaxID=2901381 RepID=UPI001F1E77F1|nr:DUF418 domain-containing protein [Cytobacillus spongiae]UII55840.1 DUF418 domain-containing protein [Cytobacillus spongiae]
MGKRTKRIVGFDLARALAILGMVIVNYKLSMKAEGAGPEWLVAFTGAFEGRASAIFVLLAGIGISLMTRQARMSLLKDTIRKNQITIWKRSVFLLGLGLGLSLLGWDADILHYYAVYLLIASFFISASNKILLTSTLTLLVSSQIFQLLFDYTKGWDTSFQSYETFWTVNGFISNLLFNGYHPIFPWVCFFLFGMWFGRLDFNNKKLRINMLIISIVGATIFEATSYLLIQVTSTSLGLEIAQYLFSTKPMPPNMFYMLASTSTALIVILLCVYLSETLKNGAITKAFVYTGQMALTHYVGHFLLLFVFHLAGQLDKSSSLFFSTICAFSFFFFAMIFSIVWKKFFERGPIELVMRKISG